MNNDYENGKISKEFFGEDGISQTQIKYAKSTSELIDKSEHTSIWNTIPNTQKCFRGPSQPNC